MFTGTGSSVKIGSSNKACCVTRGTCASDNLQLLSCCGKMTSRALLNFLKVDCLHLSTRVIKTCDLNTKVQIS